MQPDDSRLRILLTTHFTEAVIRLSLIALLAVLCVRIFAPFANLMVWALILSVALYPLQQRLARRLGGRQGFAAILVVLAGLVLIGGPTVMLGDSFARQVHKAHTSFENNTVSIKPPPPEVAELPLVGKQIYSAWSAAADNFPVFLQQNQRHFKEVAKRALLAAANTAGSLVLFLGSVIIAGAMMAYGESGRQVMQRICNRLAGATKGPRLLRLSTATIRSVASGVIGVAFIQALLLGIGFILVGIPAAGVLAFVVLLFGILQLPAALISLPVIVYLWWGGDASTASNIFYTIYLVVAGMADNVLKPLLLGRGVEAPMPVILLGALGGMATGGIIGLFTGAVLLAVGYQLFMGWVDNAEVGPGIKPAPTGPVEQTSLVDE